MAMQGTTKKITEGVIGAVVITLIVAIMLPLAQDFVADANLSGTLGTIIGYFPLIGGVVAFVGLLAFLW